MTKQQHSNVGEAILLAAAISDLRSNTFPSALRKWLHSCFEHDNITILAYFPETRPQLLMSESKPVLAHENAIKDYLAGVYLLDPFHDLHLKKVPAGIYRLSDIAPDSFLRSRYFLEYYRQTTLADEIGFIMYPSADISLHICVDRDSQSGTRFNARELAIAKRIFPIVASLATAHWGNLTAEKGQIGKASPPNLAGAAQQKLGISLSPRQAEVAMFILQGHSSTSIGLRLGISPQTVKVFRKQLYRKCQISSQAELFSLMLPIMSYEAHSV